MSHRVIGGTARGRQLKLVPGDSTRPIKDLVKESLFNIIGADIVDARVLDLFGGTGAVGIESLSRGAKAAVFCELDRLAIKTINENLKDTRLEARATVRRANALDVIRAKPPLEPYDFIYVAPPQYKGVWLEVLNILDENIGWLSDETTVIVQIDPDEYTEPVFKNLELDDERKYGKTLLLFYVRNSISTDEG
jgi:16S rRNA (guanine966-N2)-methyltransferase